MPGKHILLISPTTTYRLRDFLHAAAKLGGRVFLASNRCHKLAQKWPEANQIAVSFASPTKAAAQLLAALQGQTIHAVIATDDDSTAISSHVAQALGLPAHGTAAIQNARNKLLFRQTMHQSGLPSPEFGSLSIDQTPEDSLPAVSFPCVLKPLMLSGSRGVIRADHAREFRSAFYRIKNILTHREFAHIHCDPAFRQILVERYIPGIEVAIEGILTRGKLQILAIFDKPDPLEGPFFEETIYVTPTQLAKDLQARIHRTLARACQALELYHGPIHAEARINPKGVYLIEVAPRTIGGLCSRTLRFSSGMSLEELVIRHALGEKLVLQGLQRSASGVMMIPIPRAGKLHKVTGMSEALSVPGIEDVQITIPRNHLVIPLPEGSSYLGFIFARGDSPAEVVHALRNAHQKLHFDIRPSLQVVESEAAAAALQ